MFECVAGVVCKVCRVLSVVTLLYQEYTHQQLQQPWQGDTLQM